MHLFITINFICMPVTKSAKKALRTAIRRHEENLVHKTSYKKALKDARKAHGAEEAQAKLSEAQSALDKAAKTKSMHPNKAARLKSRLAKKLNTAIEAPAVKEKKVTTKKKAPANKKKS